MTAAWAQGPAFERFHDMLPAQDLVGLSPAVTADFDGDGDLDVASGPSVLYPGRSKALWLNDGDAVFSEAPGAFPHTPYPSRDLAAADFDGDGLADVFEARAERGDGLFHNLGAGSFADASFSLPPGLSRCAAVLDYDQDGDLDVFANRLIENLGGLAFQDASAALPLSSWHTAPAGEAADLDGDGWTDLFLLYSSETAQTLMNMGGTGGTFALGSTLPGGSWSSFSDPVLALADLDGDLDVDAVFGGSGEPVLARNQGSGLFEAFFPFPSDPYPLALDRGGR